MHLPISGPQGLIQATPVLKNCRLLSVVVAVVVVVAAVVAVVGGVVAVKFCFFLSLAWNLSFAHSSVSFQSFRGGGGRLSLSIS